MHTSSPLSRLWFGAQTADNDSDWLKQQKKGITTGRFVLAERNSFETVVFRRFYCTL